MDKRVIFGGVVGALVIVAFALGSPLSLNRFSLDSISWNNLLLSLVVLLMAPIAGGFLAGWIGDKNPRQAGLLAGFGAGLVLLIAWSVIVGCSLEASLSAVVIGFIWVFLSRVGAGFSSTR